MIRTGILFIEKYGSVCQEYRDFHIQNGEWTQSTADFYETMDATDFEKHKTRAGIVVEGLRLRVIKQMCRSVQVISESLYAREKTKNQKNTYYRNFMI